jgi:glycosyltransferase involved in cell wall biosynthesis
MPAAEGVKTLVSVHDVMPEIYMTKFGVPKTDWRIRLIKLVEVVSAGLADRVLTAEHPKADLLAEHGVPADRVHVLLNLPDDALFVPQFVLPDPALTSEAAGAESELRLIYHGTIAHRLGMDIAVDALHAVRTEIPGARMQVFGDGDQLPELHRQVEKLGISDRVWFSDGYVPIEEIIPSIQRAHLAVLPTRHTAGTDYMLPTKMLEYLALGIPAIVTPTKTVRFYFGDEHPLYIPDPTLAATADRIRWVRNNYAEAKRLTAELQASWLSRYHWPTHKLSYLELLDELRR